MSKRISHHGVVVGVDGSPSSRWRCGGRPGGAMRHVRSPSFTSPPCCRGVDAGVACRPSP